MKKFCLVLILISIAFFSISCVRFSRVTTQEGSNVLLAEGYKQFIPYFPVKPLFMECQDTGNAAECQEKVFP